MGKQYVGGKMDWETGAKFPKFAKATRQLDWTNSRISLEANIPMQIFLELREPYITVSMHRSKVLQCEVYQIAFLNIRLLYRIVGLL